MSNIRNPDLELPRNSLDKGPSWIESSKRSPNSDRELLSRLLRSLQAFCEIPRRRIEALGESDLESWSKLETEQPYWILNSSYIGPNTNFNSFISSTGTVPYLTNSPGLLLNTPGILVTDGTVSSSGGYFIRLPETVTKESFWTESTGPRILVSDKIYARNLDIVQLKNIVGSDSPLGGKYSYTVDTNTDLYVVPSSGAATFDTPDESSSFWFRRLPDGSVYSYPGSWQTVA